MISIWPIDEPQKSAFPLNWILANARVFNTMQVFTLTAQVLPNARQVFLILKKNRPQILSPKVKKYESIQIRSFINAFNLAPDDGNRQRADEQRRETTGTITTADDKSFVFQLRRWPDRAS